MWAVHGWRNRDGPGLTSTCANAQGLAFLHAALAVSGGGPGPTIAKLAVNLAAKGGDARALLRCLR